MNRRLDGIDGERINLRTGLIGPWLLIPAGGDPFLDHFYVAGLAREMAWRDVVARSLQQRQYNRAHKRALHTRR